MFIAVLCFICSFLFSACSKESNDARSNKDSLKNEISDSSFRKDTLKLVKDEALAKKKAKTKIIKKNELRNPEDISREEAEKKDKIRIIAFYFHPTARCQTCLNIENFTKEVIQTRFEKEVEDGIITFRALNIEDSVNEHYIEDYNLQFSSLILAKFVNNNQTKWKNLEHVWKFANDKEQFFKYASIEIKGYLKERE